MLGQLREFKMLWSLIWKMDKIVWHLLVDCTYIRTTSSMCGILLNQATELGDNWEWFCLMHDSLVSMLKD